MLQSSPCKQRQTHPSSSMQPLTQCIYLILMHLLWKEFFFAIIQSCLKMFKVNKQCFVKRMDLDIYFTLPTVKVHLCGTWAAVDATRQHFSGGQWVVWHNLHKTEVKWGERLCEFGKSTFCSALWIWTAANPGKPHLGPNASYICMHMCVGWVLNMYLFLWRSER